MFQFDEIKVAAFDIDGTLYPNYQMYIWGLPQIIFHPKLIHAYNQVRKEIRKVSTEGERFSDAQARLMAVHLEILTSTAAQKVERHLYRPWGRQTKIIKPIKGLRPFLEALKQKGIVLYALSDFPVGKKLEYLGVADLFTKSLCSEDFGRLKPDPQPFYALQKVAKVDFDKILYFGNSYEKDIEGAGNVGMKTAYISKRLKKGQSSHIVFQNYQQLLEKYFPQEGE